MNRKKLLVAGVSLLTVAAVSVGATLAYFTDTSDAKANTFTMGHVSIDIVDKSNQLDQKDYPYNRVVADDPDVDGDGLQFKDVLPGDIIDKTVGVTLEKGSMDAWLAIKVNVAATPRTGSSLDSANVQQELIDLINDELYDVNWVSGDPVAEEDGTTSVVYYYKEPVSVTDSNNMVTLFRWLKIPGADWGNDYAGLGFSLTVQAAGVQADNVTFADFQAMDWSTFEEYPTSSSADAGSEDTTEDETPGDGPIETN